jgi:hypothetical protein
MLTSTLNIAAFVRRTRNTLLAFVAGVIKMDYDEYIKEVDKFSGNEVVARLRKHLAECTLSSGVSSK